MLTTILWSILVGAVIGALARVIVPGRNPIGVVLTVLVGIAGSLLGGVIAEALGAGTMVALLFAVIIAALGVALLTAANRGGRWGRGSTRSRTF
ncbi:hypothetical protein DPM19_19565 [Actinomadura craniellae]|uniref:GlsB/YeaQ/YmgE family stress response membrane protein n=1 Tax=Actinomadura craniellae TaxID=2231787 RepID=A0A365H2N1_9ACTN|nr:GlsB/YeaQ/YmgE family stress response membrane protein [Actinomadura craniellae]RAY13288.1 hypothetical protein DPM19_19565 [Actinomadura craniellae]